MQTYRLAIIGFGNVGQGFASILRDKGDELAQRFGARFQIVAVCDLLKGSVADENGFDPATLLDSIAATSKLDRVSAPHRDWDALQTIERSNADIVIELSLHRSKNGRTGDLTFATRIGTGQARHHHQQRPDRAEIP